MEIIPQNLSCFLKLHFCENLVTYESVNDPFMKIRQVNTFSRYCTFKNNSNFNGMFSSELIVSYLEYFLCQHIPVKIH